MLQRLAFTNSGRRGEFQKEIGDETATEPRKGMDYSPLAGLLNEESMSNNDTKSYPLGVDVRDNCPRWYKLKENVKVKQLPWFSKPVTWLHPEEGGGGHFNNFSGKRANKTGPGFLSTECGAFSTRQGEEERGRGARTQPADAADLTWKSVPLPPLCF